VAVHAAARCEVFDVSVPGAVSFLANGVAAHNCFEVAMHRDKYPEKVPFRLTRMLINAMEVSGIEGTFRSTCENVMRVLRDNKESLMAVLEAFVHDPLITWRLLAPASPVAGGLVGMPPPDAPAALAGARDLDDNDDDDSVEEVPSEAVVAAAAAAAAAAAELKSKAGDDDATTAPDDEEEAEDEVIPEVLNERALSVINRVQNKLTGRDFGPSNSEAALDVAEQVQRLIVQATSHENLAQLYVGWCGCW
jgi:FKBP12-rapamycin complex-associated protein